MNIPEEFGNYLLLKKLTEDPLGETFRAGKVGKEGMDQVVLLRVLNGKGMDGERLWQKVSGRGIIQQALKSPNIGNGVDLGRVRSYPYTAYDYISGKNLAVLLAQSTKQMSPIPADHALLMAERLSLALAVASESRVADERVLHGFVVPQLVMVSNEGETRLLGFEIAPGLREIYGSGTSGWRDSDLTPYLAPEAMAAEPVGKADDVWSLGAILFELLTGERLPPATAEGYGPAIDAAVVANDGAPLAAPIAALLKKSLVPRDQRIGDAVQWHKTLSKLMSDGHYSPTTFNLAFFMHNLFRDEIERESQEMQAEKKLAVSGLGGLGGRSAAASTMATMAIPVAAAGAAAHSAHAAHPPGTAAGDVREKTGVREPTWPGISAPASSAGSKKGVMAAVAAVLLVGLGVGGWFLFGRNSGTHTAKTPVPAAQPAALPVPAAPAQGTEAAAASPSPEEIQKQIAAMFEARSKEMEAKLKGQYDDKIKGLQKQLEDSKKSPAAPAPSTRTEPAPEPKAPPKPEPAVEKERERETTTVAQAVPPPVPVAPAPRPEPPKAEPPPQQSRPAPAPAPRDPQVQMGDLVQLGPGVVKPQVAGIPEPRYPATARRMNKAALIDSVHIDMKVLVDERGNVVQAELTGPRVGFGFDEAAVEAARRATFRPATKDGVRVKMWTMLRLTFRP